MPDLKGEAFAVTTIAVSQKLLGGVRRVSPTIRNAPDRREREPDVASLLVAKGAAAIPELKELLSEKNPLLVAATIHILGKMGKDAIPALTEAANHHETAVALTAIVNLAKLSAREEAGQALHKVFERPVLTPKDLEQGLQILESGAVSMISMRQTLGKLAQQCTGHTQERLSRIVKMLTVKREKFLGAMDSLFDKLGQPDTDDGNANTSFTPDEEKIRRILLKNKEPKN